nr:class I SAM-dependent methyltransferase [Agrococcus sp. KRD186]
MLADRGIEVVGVDPARASVDVARSKPGAERVRWHVGTLQELEATDALLPLGADVATMTANVAQVFIDDADWHAGRGLGGGDGRRHLGARRAARHVRLADGLPPRRPPYRLGLDAAVPQPRAHRALARRGRLRAGRRARRARPAGPRVGLPGSPPRVSGGLH